MNEDIAKEEALLLFLRLEGEETLKGRFVCRPPYGKV